MYQSYPASGPAQELSRVQPPPSVRNAVLLMYAGAVLEVIALIVAVLTTSSLKAAILKAHPAYTAAQVHTAEDSRTVSLVVGAVITIGLWLWMAWANGRGHDWARGVFTTFLGLTTLSLLGWLAGSAVLYATADLIAVTVLWLVQMAAMVLIFSRKSASYYRHEPAER